MELNRKLDYKKEYKDLYLPKTKPMMVEVPEIAYISVEGNGNPNTSEDYRQALEILYGLSFTIKMSPKSGIGIPGYFDYVVPPLEGLWQVEGEAFDGKNMLDKERFHWFSLIRQPEFVTEEIYEWAKGELGKKKPDLDFSTARFVKIKEGLCAQVMHMGPYDEEPQTIENLDKFIRDEGFATDITDTRLHHEIYLGDPRRTKPENLKTVIRHPVKRL